MIATDVNNLVYPRLDEPWCLFLDRDGVINKRTIDGYIRDWSEFIFEPGAIEALQFLSGWAPKIVVVTNQQGVGKQFISVQDLSDIHAKMLEKISRSGGRVDEIKFCPHLATDGCECRKPNPGMAQSFLATNPNLNSALSVIVGDSDSDIKMGQRLAEQTGGCFTVRIGQQTETRAHLVFPSLSDFALAVKKDLALRPNAAPGRPPDSVAAAGS